MKRFEKRVVRVESEVTGGVTSRVCVSLKRGPVNTTDKGEGLRKHTDGGLKEDRKTVYGGRITPEITGGWRD